MAAWADAQARAVAEPIPRPRRRAEARARARSRRHARRGILWIVIGGILAAGVVFISVADLRTNLALNSANQQRTQLVGENAALEAQLAAELASPRIQTEAQRQLGVRPVDPASVAYLDLSR